MELLSLVWSEKMKISTDSWHYKLLSRVWKYGLPYNSPPNNLCKYFWLTVATTLIYPLWRVSVALDNIDFDVKGPNWKWPDKWPSKSTMIDIIMLIWTFGFGIFDLMTGSYILAGIMFGIGIWWLLPKSFKRRIRYRYQYKPPKPKKPKQPNIAIEYIKAKKKRVCPLLEFVNPIEEEGLR
jgi:hypothetical protein